MQNKIASAKMPGGWRPIKLVAGSAALTMAAFGGIVGISALPAYAASISSANYTIGANATSPTNVSATATSLSSSAASIYTITFKSPGGTLASGDDIYLSESDSAAALFCPSGVPVPKTSITVEDLSNPTDFPTQAPGVTSCASGVLTIPITGADSIPAGDTIQVQISTTNPAETAATPITIGVATTNDSAAANAAPLTIAAGAATPGVSLSVGLPAPQAPSANSLYTFSNIAVAGLTNAGTTTVGITAAPPSGTPGPTNATQWDPTTAVTVTSTNSSGVSSSVSVSSIAVNGTGNVLTITLASSIYNGDTLAITAYGTNPSTSGDTDTYSVTPTGGTVQAAGTVTFGSQVTLVTATPIPATENASSTYVVSFKATTGIAANTADAIAVTFPSDTTVGAQTTAAVSDTTSGLIDSTAPATKSGQTVYVEPNFAITAGDTVNVQVSAITNPDTVETETALTVNTSADALPAATTTGYAIVAANNAAPSVSVSPNTPGVSADYTVSNFTATANITADSSSAGNTLTLASSAGSTYFPDVASDYSITDATNSAGSGTVPTITAGGDGDTVTFEVPNNISSGDKITITADNVINPTPGTYTLTLTGSVGYITLPAFPNASLTYPNGSIVDFSGTDYVFAGGHAFGIPNPAVLASVQAVDHATVITALAGTTTPVVPPRVGTLLVDNGTIYVVGTDGDLYGFATPTQFLQAGYDPALTISVPNLSGLTVNSETVGAAGSAENALATSADGAIVNTTPTFYVFAGGRAFGIPNGTVLAAVQGANYNSTVLSGSIAASATTAAIANGTVVTVGGGVWVAYGGSLYPFKNIGQLDADGYGGTPAITLPNVGGLTLVTSYSGS